MKPTAHSAPAPQTPEATRLEYVRTDRGFSSLRSFWQTLREAGSSYSYEAVRNYHYDREAPVGYLKDIRKVFPQFSLSYLAGETDTPTEQHAQTNTAARMASTFSENPEVLERAAAESKASEMRALHRRVAIHRMWYEIREAMGASDGSGIDIPHWESRHAHVPYWMPPLADIRRRVWGRYMLGSAPNVAHQDDFRAERWIGNALRGPLEGFSIDPKSFEYSQLGTYIVNMLPALNWLINAGDQAAMEKAMQGTWVPLPPGAEEALAKIRSQGAPRTKAAISRSPTKPPTRTKKKRAK